MLPDHVIINEKKMAKKKGEHYYDQVDSILWLHKLLKMENLYLWVKLSKDVIIVSSKYSFMVIYKHTTTQENFFKLLMVIF